MKHIKREGDTISFDIPGIFRSFIAWIHRITAPPAELEQWSPEEIEQIKKSPRTPAEINMITPKVNKLAGKVAHWNREEGFKGTETTSQMIVRMDKENPDGVTAGLTMEQYRELVTLVLGSGRSKWTDAKGLSQIDLTVPGVIGKFGNVLIRVVQ